MNPGLVRLLKRLSLSWALSLGISTSKTVRLEGSRCMGLTACQRRFVPMLVALLGAASWGPGGRGRRRPVRDRPEAHGLHSQAEVLSPSWQSAPSKVPHPWIVADDCLQASECLPPSALTRTMNRAC